ncbi:hypothetical protein MUY14_43820 [Amycolatopsis sp. FBCC-B4732]|uniref:hypothetical protein n=1 Tax=Amycolatopsis sp. FBCC-B4732 TaxID=3079339 RepID=UPI001FF2AFF8|nr:hypothetical protein [Amycolatopsis sp. FBCC-B4732]UOX88532.1 hypothetical protein MUY14_43820 [Amycolatopsis sp. FBCC-B4732]
MAEKVETDVAESDENVEVIVRCFYLGQLIEESFVETGYDPPRAMTSQLKLSRAGSRIANQEKGASIGLHEAQLAVLITLWSGADLLIDPDGFDLESLRLHVSSELKRGKLKLPWIYGRQLYDLVADSTFHGHMQPTYDESQQLLSELPQGVFQYGPYVSGPYGVIESTQWRQIEVPFTIPAYHCEEVDCHRVHGIRFSTGESGTAKALEQTRKKAAKKHDRNDRHAEKATAFLAGKVPPYAWSYSGSLPYFLVDSFSLDELRLLLADLLDSTKGHLRTEIRRATEIEVRSADDFVAEKSNADILQLLLLASDEDIHARLNCLIRGGTIDIPSGETRLSKIHQRGDGPMQVSIDASALGVRHVPPLKLVQLRLWQVIARVFPIDDADAEAKVMWKLRGYDGDSAEKKLSAALADESPAVLIRKLIVPDEEACARVLEHLWLPRELVANLDDESLSSMLAWHIGFTNVDSDPALQSFREHADELERMALSLPVTLDRQDVKAIRGVAANLFASLEEVLKVALCFSGWALLRDHYATGAEFEYSKGQASQFMSDWLASRDIGTEVLNIEKMRLSDLLECLGSVAGFLTSAAKSPLSHRREKSKWPRFSGEVSSPFEFPFKHLLPFLDLDERSQKVLIDTLHSVVSDLNSAGALAVRNALLHHNEEVPARDKILMALSAVSGRVGEMVSVGLYPTRFTMYSNDSDLNGRRRIMLRSEEGAEVTLKRPSSIRLSGLPAINSLQVVVTRAGIGSTSEPLRFKVECDSSYREKWKDFPKRPERRVQHGLPTQFSGLGNQT